MVLFNLVNIKEPANIQKLVIYLYQYKYQNSSFSGKNLDNNVQIVNYLINYLMSNDLSNSQGFSYQVYGHYSILDQNIATGDQFNQPNLQIKQQTHKSHKPKQNLIDKSDSTIQITPSNYLQQYLQYFNQIQTLTDLHINSCLHDSREKVRHNIIIINNHHPQRNQSLSFSAPTILIQGNLFGGIIIKYEITVGNYILKIDLLNINNIAPNSLTKIGHGAYGSIYRIKYSKYKNIVAKRIIFKQKKVIEFEGRQINQNQMEINQYLYEYSIYKICSFFKIGPQIANELGFDVVCFSNCLQFYMEECLRRKYVFSRIQHDLKFCLRILHKLKIVHKDVKPANIMFSYNHNRYVLTDFGISHVIKERLGYKSKTYKQGSIGFMSLQMHQLKPGKQSYIDLYYNDLYGLKTSINEFECHYEIRELRQIKSKDNKQQLLEIFNIMEQNIYKSIYILKILLELRSKEVCLSQQQQKCYLQQEIKFMLQSIFKICLQQKQNLSTSSLMDIIQKNDYVDCLQNLIRCYGLTMELLYQLNKLNSTEQIEKIKNRIMDQKENNLISEQKIKKLKSMQAYNKYEFSLQCQLAYYRYLQKELNTSFKQKILKILLEIFFVNIQGNARFNYVDFLNLINEIKSHIKNCQIIEITQQILLFELLFQAILDKKSKQFNQIFQKCENLYPKSIQKFYKHIIKYYNVNMNNQNCIIIYGKQLELIYKQNQQIKVQYLWLLHSMAIAYQRINIKFTLYYFQQLKSKTLYYLTKIQQTNPQRIDCYSYLGIYYYSNQLYQQAITYYVKQVQMIKFVHGNYKLISAICYLNIANCFLGLTKMGEAEYYGKKAFQIIKFNSYKEYSKLQDECLCFMCMISLGLNKQQMVIAYYKQLVSRLNKKREKPIIQSSEFKIEQQYKSYSIQDFEQSMKEVDILLREGLQKEAQYIIDNQELQFQIKLQIYLRQKYYLDKIVDYSKKYNKQSGFLIQRQIKLKMNQYSFSQFIEQKLNLALLHFNTLQILKTVIEFHEMLPIKNIKLVNQIYKNICKKAQLINQLQSAKQYSLKRIQLIYGNQSQFDKHELIKCLIQLKKYFLKLKQYPEAIYYFKIFMKIHKHPQIYFVHDILSQLYMRFRTNHYNIKALNHTFKYYKMKKQLKNEKYTELKQLCKVLHKKDIIHLIDQYYMKVKATKQIHQSNANKIDQKNKQSEFFKSLKYWKKCIYLKKKFNLFQIIKIECIQQKIRKARLMLI